MLHWLLVDYGAGSLADGSIDETVPVGMDAGQGEKDAPGGNFPGIVFEPGNLRIEWRMDGNRIDVFEEG